MGLIKKYFQSRIERVIFSFKKNTTRQIFSWNFPTIERLIEFCQLPVVDLATKSTTDIVV